MINKIVLTLFSFNLLFSCCYSCDSLESLRSTFTIENHVLTTATGERYFRYPFESKLHFDLAYYMKDLRAAKIVYDSYKSNILPVVVKLSEDGTSNATNDAFSKALIEICLLFGNPKHMPEESLLHALVHQGAYGKKWTEEYTQEIRQFVQEANIPLYTIPNKKRVDAFTVVVITTTASGGNHSVAEAMISHLATNKNIKVILIDVEDIARDIDPVMIATGTYTYDMIYSSIFQKTNDFTVIPGRKKLNREIQQYIPNTLLAKLKQKVAELHPDLIISTRSYTSDDIALASLGIPFRMFHPDFELCPSLSAYYRHVSSDSIRFWLPSIRPSMFKPLFESYKHLDLYDANEACDVLFEKMSNFLSVSLKAFKDQFEVIGYPCANFFKITDEKECKALREKWRIQENEIPIFIVMGKHSTGALKDIFENLVHSETALPLKYIFICGKNSALRDELKDKLKDTHAFDVYGLLTPSEMNEIMNISFMGISKAGGATVIESLVTQKHLLLMHSYPWEEVNASYLMEVGLATKYRSTQPLVTQIENCIYAIESNKINNFVLEDWRHNLMLKVESFIPLQGE